jgi:transposase
LIFKQDIAHKYHVSRISRTLSTTIIHPKSGRPPKISLKTRGHTVRQVTAGFLNNAVEVQKYLKDEHGIDITASRVRQFLRQEDLTAQHKIDSKTY